MLQDPTSRKFRRNVFLVGTGVALAVSAAVFTWVPPSPPSPLAQATKQPTLLASKEGAGLGEEGGQGATNAPAPAGPRPGHETYQTYCAQCHGDQGQGGEHSTVGKMMSIKPPSLVKGPFKFRRTPEALVALINNGVGYMPGFGRELSEEEALMLAEFTASLEQKGGQ